MTNRNVVARYSYGVPTWNCPSVTVAVKYAFDNGAAPVTNGVWLGKIEKAL